MTAIYLLSGSSSHLLYTNSFFQVVVFTCDFSVSPNCKCWFTTLWLFWIFHHCVIQHIYCRASTSLYVPEDNSDAEGHKKVTFSNQTNEVKLGWASELQCSDYKCIPPDLNFNTYFLQIELNSFCSEKRKVLYKWSDLLSSHWMSPVRQNISQFTG